MIFSKFARSRSIQTFSLSSRRKFHQFTANQSARKSTLLTSTLLTSLACLTVYTASNDSKMNYTPLKMLFSTSSHCNSILSDIKDQLTYLEGIVTNWSFLFTEIEEIKKNNPQNIMARHFSASYFLSLTPIQQKKLYKIIKSGLENPTSSLGCYAMTPTDYDEFKPYLDLVIRDYHKISLDIDEVEHKTNWQVDKDSENLDLSKLGLDNISMRVRVGRNLASFPLPGAMTRNDRIELEKVMIKAFKKLIADERYGGNYYSLTPNTEFSINDEFYKDLVKAHIMFKDMDNDSYLKSAGIASDWPYGRGCYVSKDKEFIVWVGEEDHLRIMCMKKGKILNEVFNRLSIACEVVEKYASKFAHSKNYGYVTSCPTNLGTGMRASVHIKVPNLTSDGTDKKAKEVAKPLGLSVRGVGGEHTPIGKDGTIDISPSARLCIEEREIIKKLYQGIELLLKEEKKAANGNSKL